MVVPEPSEQDGAERRRGAQEREPPRLPKTFREAGGAWAKPKQNKEKICFIDSYTSMKSK